MRSCVRKTLSLAIAVLLIGAGAAVAGQNANAVISLNTASELSGIGGGASIQVGISATGMTDVKQLFLRFEVDPVTAFDMTTAALATNPTLALALPAVVTGSAIEGGAASFGAALPADADLGTLTISTAADLTTSTQATITVVQVQIGPSATTKDTILANLVVTINPPAPAPTVASIAPAEGSVSGGTSVTITGTNFVDGATVTIGGAAATEVIIASATSITATAPVGAVGAADVTVSNADLQADTLTGGYTYLAIPPPTVASIAPVEGSMAGGTSITITGTGFSAGATVSIGGAAATAASVVSATSITATTPAGTAGAVDVVVTNADSQAGTLAAGYTFLSIIEPILARATPRSSVRGFSAVGNGDVADGSAGEVTVGVTFSAPGGDAGQDVSFAVTNNGAEMVYAVGASATEIAANSTIAVVVATDAGGSASITLDSEGDRQAGSTSVSVSASITAANSDGAVRDLSVTFDATWDVPVVAELAAFAGSVTPGLDVVLEWGVVSQTGNLGWEVFRSTDNVNFERVGNLVEGAGTSDEYLLYSFRDETAPAADVLYYYLNQVDLDGSSARSNVLEIVVSEAIVLPTSMALLQNYPNPFNPETTITFDVSEESVVTLRIYDLTGQVVRTLVSGERFGAGQHQSLWDGRSESGLRVASGVYFYQLSTDSFTSMKKMTLLQ
jgi:hypothetical protein